MLEVFAWDDSILCWLFFAQAVLCYLYRRYIEDRVAVLPLVAWTFIFLSAASLVMLLFSLSEDSLYGPVAPTVLFFVFWHYDLMQTVLRFTPRCCKGCGGQMAISVYDARVLPLYGEGRICDRDLWFCPACLEVSRESFASAQHFCRRCLRETAHDTTYAILAPPHAESIGTTSHRVVCRVCGTVHRRRELVRPLLRGPHEQIFRKERELVRNLNRLSVLDE